MEDLKKNVKALKNIETADSKHKSSPDNDQEEEVDFKEITAEEIDKLKTESQMIKNEINEILTPEFSEDLSNLLVEVYSELDLSQDEIEKQNQITENAILESEISDEEKEKILSVKNEVDEKIQNRKNDLIGKGEEKLTAEEKKELETINKYEKLQQLQKKQKEIEEQIGNSVGKTEIDQKKLDELKKLNEEEKGEANVKVKECLAPQAGLIAVGPLVALIGIPPFSLIGLLAIMKVLPMFPKKKMEQTANKEISNNEEQKPDESKKTAFGTATPQEPKKTAFGNAKPQEPKKIAFGNAKPEGEHIQRWQSKNSGQNNSVPTGGIQF